MFAGRGFLSGTTWPANKELLIGSSGLQTRVWSRLPAISRILAPRYVRYACTLPRPLGFNLPSMENRANVGEPDRSVGSVCPVCGCRVCLRRTSLSVSRSLRAHPEPASVPKSSGLCGPLLLHAPGVFHGRGTARQGSACCPPHNNHIAVTRRTCRSGGTPHRLAAECVTDSAPRGVYKEAQPAHAKTLKLVPQVTRQLKMYIACTLCRPEGNPVPVAP